MILLRRKRFQQSTTKTIISEHEFELKFNVSGGHFLLNEKSLHKLPNTFLGSRIDHQWNGLIDLWFMIYDWYKQNPAG